MGCSGSKTRQNGRTLCTRAGESGPNEISAIIEQNHPLCELSKLVATLKIKWNNSDKLSNLEDIKRISEAITTSWRLYNTSGRTIAADFDVLVALEIVPMIIDVMKIGPVKELLALGFHCLEILVGVSRKMPQYAIDCGLRNLTIRILSNEEIPTLCTTEAFLICHYLAKFSLDSMFKKSEKEIESWRGELHLNIQTSTKILGVAATLFSCMVLNQPASGFYTVVTGNVLGEDIIEDEQVRDYCLWTVWGDLLMLSQAACNQNPEEFVRYLPVVITFLENREWEWEFSTALAAWEILKKIIQLSNNHVRVAIDVGLLRILKIYLDFNRPEIMNEILECAEIIAGDRKCGQAAITNDVEVVGKIIGAYFRLKDNTEIHWCLYIGRVLNKIFPEATSTQLQLMLISTPLIPFLLRISRELYRSFLRDVTVQIVRKIPMRDIVQNVIDHPQYHALIAEDDAQSYQHYFYGWNRVGLDNQVWLMILFVCYSLGVEGKPKLLSSTVIYEYCRLRSRPDYALLRHIRTMTLLVATTSLERFSHEFRTPLNIDIFRLLHSALIGTHPD